MVKVQSNTSSGLLQLFNEQRVSGFFPHGGFFNALQFVIGTVYQFSGSQLHTLTDINESVKGVEVLLFKADMWLQLCKL